MARSETDASSGRGIDDRCLHCGELLNCSLASSFIDLDVEQLENPPGNAEELAGGSECRP
jgi:hypothetical protein